MPVVTITQPAAHKCGSTWTFVLTRRQPDGTPVDLAGLTVRAMFRAGSVSGDVLATLTDGAGLTISPAAGQVAMTIEATTSATVEPGAWVYFDVEMMSATGHVWQSSTYRFKAEAEVTV
jgi:hypothetical protein